MTGARAQAGFTLVELMIIVAIIGILAAVGVPSMMGIMPRVRLNTNVMVLANEIALARVRAISKSTEFRIVFDPANENYTAYKYQAGGWQSLGVTELSGSDLASVAGFRRDVMVCGSRAGDVLPTSGTPLTMVVCADGQANVQLNSTATIEIRTPDAEGRGRKLITVEPTGRMYVQKWNGSSWVGD